MRIHIVLRKTLEDFSSPKLLLFFLIPFLLIALLISAGASVGITQTLPSGVYFSSLPLRMQEQTLAGLSAMISFIWTLGIPVMALVGVISAKCIAGEEEEGSLRILLSKPVRRWEVILGKFLGILIFTFLIMLAGLFIHSLFSYSVLGASSTALSTGVVSPMLPKIVYALFTSFFVGSIATGIAVLTGSKTKTLLVVIVVFALMFFGFIIVRLATEPTGVYKGYGLYSVDVNYHLGNSYVFIHDSLGAQLDPPIQSEFGAMAGTYDISGAGVDPLIGGMPASLPLKGYVSPLGSFIGILLVSVAVLASATFYFGRKEIA